MTPDRDALEAVAYLSENWSPEARAAALEALKRKHAGLGTTLKNVYEPGTVEHRMNARLMAHRPEHRSAKATEHARSESDPAKRKVWEHLSALHAHWAASPKAPHRKPGRYGELGGYS